MPKQTMYTIQGAVINKTGQPLPGLRIRAFDKDPKTPDNFLGTEVVTGDKGEYRITYTEKDFRIVGHESGGPDIVVRVYDAQLTLLGESPLKKNAGKTVTIQVRVDYTPPQVTHFRVQGHVWRENALPAAGLPVRAWDQRLSGETLLGAATTDSAGHFEIAYDSSGLPAGKNRADLLLRVFPDSQAVKPIATAPLRYDAATDETVNLFVLDQDLPKRTEYENLLAALTPYLGDKPLRSLQEDAEKQEITYLSRKTGWDARLIALAALADEAAFKVKAAAHQKMKSRSAALAADVPAGADGAAMFYGAYRAGIPTGAEIISHIDTTTFFTYGTAAVEQGIIPALADGEVVTLQNDLQQYQVAQVLEGPPLTGVSSFGRMLELATLDTAEQQRFTENFLQYRGDTTIFWQQVETEFGPQKAGELRLSQLGALTGNHAPLIATLKNRQLVSADPIDLVRNGLYTADAWMPLINDVDLPEGLQGDTLEVRATGFAGTAMSVQLQLRYPDAVLAERSRQAPCSLIPPAWERPSTIFLPKTRISNWGACRSGNTLTN